MAELIAARLPSVEQVRFTKAAGDDGAEGARATGRPKIAKCGAYRL